MAQVTTTTRPKQVASPPVPASSSLTRLSDGSHETTTTDAASPQVSISDSTATNSSSTAWAPRASLHDSSNSEAAAADLPASLCPSDPIPTINTTKATAQSLPAPAAAAAAAEAAAAVSNSATACISHATSRSLLLILHGKRAADDLLREAIAELKAEGHKVSVRVTFDRGDVEAFIDEAVRLNDNGTTQYHTIVAGGGDGTLNEVVCALMAHREALQRHQLAVALLPLGTANDFACAAGISVDPRAALRTALDPSTIHPIDVAAVNGRCFMNIAVAGSVAAVSAEELASKWKRLLGPAAIAWHVLQRVVSPGALQPHRNVTVTFCPEPATHAEHTAHTTSGSGSPTFSSSISKTFTADLLMLAAGNSRQMGRQVNVCPDALLDDGLLDFTLLTGDNATREAAGLLSALVSPSAPDAVLLDRGIAQLKASRLEVSAAAADDALPINRDGEPEDASNRLVFEVYPKALLMHLPDSRMLQQHRYRQQLQQQQLETALSTSSIASASDNIVKGNVATAGEITPITVTPTDAADGGGGGCGGNSAAEAPAGSAKQHSSGSNNNKKAGRGHVKQRKLRKRTLQRMVAVAQPEGREVRQRQQMVKAVKALGSWALVMLVGAGAGWLVGARQDKSREGDGQVKQQKQGSGVVKGRKKDNGGGSMLCSSSDSSKGQHMSFAAAAAE